MHAATKHFTDRYGVRRLDAAFSGAGSTAPLRNPPTSREDRQGRASRNGRQGRKREPLRSLRSHRALRVRGAGCVRHSATLR